MNSKSFESLIAWQKARELNILTLKKASFIKDFYFRNQLQRAVLSVMNNIAEGLERQTTKEYIYFLYIAKGSCGEVRSMIYLAEDLMYLSSQDCKDICYRAREVTALLYGLICALRDK